jgi:hypothetical protein
MHTHSQVHMMSNSAAAVPTSTTCTCTVNSSTHPRGDGLDLCTQHAARQRTVQRPARSLQQEVQVLLPARRNQR